MGRKMENQAEIMKNAIKIYKPLCAVYLADGEILFSDLNNMLSIIEDSNNTKINLVMIDGLARSRFDIKKVEPYNPEGSDVKTFIATRSPDERRALARRNRQKLERVGREIETVDEAINYLDRRRKGEIKD